MQAACTIQLNLHVPLDEARHLVQLNLRCVRLQSARFHCAQAQRPVPHLRSVAWQDGSSGDHCAAGGSLCPPPPLRPEQATQHIKRQQLHGMQAQVA